MIGKRGNMERERGLGARYLEANTELRHLAFSRTEWTVVPLEERKGWKGSIHQRQI